MKKLISFKKKNSGIVEFIVAGVIAGIFALTSLIAIGGVIGASCYATSKGYYPRYYRPYYASPMGMM